jgi:hypothetical protein
MKIYTGLVKGLPLEKQYLSGFGFSVYSSQAQIQNRLASERK